MTDTVQQLVRTLADDHPRSGHVETGLLVSLVEACSGHLSHGGRTGGASSGIPLNGDAIALADKIRGELIRHLALDGIPIKVLPLPDLLTYWHREWSAGYPSPAQHAAWIETLTEWEVEVRRTIRADTWNEAPVQHGECPICGKSRTVTDDLETWALWREWDSEAPTASMRLTCRACDEVLAWDAKTVAVVLGVDMAAEITRIASDGIQ